MELSSCSSVVPLSETQLHLTISRPVEHTRRACRHDIPAHGISVDSRGTSVLCQGKSAFSDLSQTAVDRLWPVRICGPIRTTGLLSETSQQPAFLLMVSWHCCSKMPETNLEESGRLAVSLTSAQTRTAPTWDEIPGMPRYVATPSGLLLVNY